MNMKKLFSTVSTVVFLSAASLLSENALANDQDIIDTMEKSRASVPLLRVNLQKKFQILCCGF